MTRLPEFLYHYTKTSSLVHLLDTSRLLNRSKEDKDSDVIRNCALCFHATDIKSFEDNFEHIEYFRFLERVKKSKADDLFNEAINGKVYVVSFSSLENSAQMWKLYADEGKGICLKFDTKKILEQVILRDQAKNMDTILSACDYAISDELSKELKRLENLYNNNEFENDFFGNFKDFVDFRLKCAFLKNASYETEKEYRIVKSDRNYSFRTDSSGFIAFTELLIPLSCLVEIQLGPKCPKRYQYSIKRWLEPILRFADGYNIRINDDYTEQ